MLCTACSNFPFGFFNAFGNPGRNPLPLDFRCQSIDAFELVARKDSVDYVLHLGDYIYEYVFSESIFLPHLGLSRQSEDMAL